MKKILFVVLFLVGFNSIAQEPTQEHLDSLFKANVKFNHYNKALMIVNSMETIHGVTELSTFRKAAIPYYILYKDLEAQKTELIKIAVNSMDKIINDGKATKEHVYQLKYMRTVLSFAFLHYRSHRVKLTSVERKKIVTAIKQDSNILTRANVIDLELQKDIDRILVKIKDNYELYTNPITKIGM